MTYIPSPELDEELVAQPCVYMDILKTPQGENRYMVVLVGGEDYPWKLAQLPVQNEDEAISLIEQVDSADEVYCIEDVNELYFTAKDLISHLPDDPYTLPLVQEWLNTAKTGDHKWFDEIYSHIYVYHKPQKEVSK